MSADNTFAAAEAALSGLLLKGKSPLPAPAIFILGSPRTGSTALYQTMIEAFRLPYFANLTNDHFHEAPAAGLAIQSGLAGMTRVEFASRFGKTEGILQPSEASAVMRNWFGGGHPSQKVSADILPGKQDHLRSTLAVARTLFGKPLLIKNAWNCFRVPALCRLLPEAFFIWIRRDIGAAAKSDLHARYAVQGSPTAWNSATPSNLESLRQRPYWEQVVENQYEFTVAMQEALAEHARGRHVEIWYEDFCADPGSSLKLIARVQPALGAPADLGPRQAEIQRSAEQWELTGEDIARIDAHLRQNEARFRSMRYAAKPPATSPAPQTRDAAGWHLSRVNGASLQGYLRDDWVQRWLNEHSRQGDDRLTTQRWLVESPAKRHILAELYGDLLKTEGRRILDVGGGISAMTRELSRRHRYELVELLAHEAGTAAADAAGRHDGCRLHHCDWLELQPEDSYDLVIANDLFPNVDQRLELFLSRFAPRCHEMRISLTFFEEPRFYRTRRTDGEEILFMLAWTWEQLRMALERAGGPHLVPQLDAIGTPSPSIFPNRRQVALLTVRNILAGGTGTER